MQKYLTKEIFFCISFNSYQNLLNRLDFGAKLTVHFLRESFANFVAKKAPTYLYYLNVLLESLSLTLALIFMIYPMTIPKWTQM